MDNINITPIPTDTLDEILSIQLLIAWAGETGEEGLSGSTPSRLGWWDTDLLSEFGGADLLKEIAPSSWLWLCFKAAREAACRQNEQLRKHASDPDEVYTLFRQGHVLDELLTQRLDELIHRKTPIQDVLGYTKFFDERPEEQEWSKADFEGWLKGLGDVKAKSESIGRLLSSGKDGHKSC